MNNITNKSTSLRKAIATAIVKTSRQETIDAVLNAPRTDYLFFVARSDFSGYHQFTSNFAEHDKYAKLYQQALNEQIAKRMQDSLKNTQH